LNEKIKGETMSKEISRRKFITGIAAGAISVVGSNMLTGCANQPESVSVPADEVAWEDSADLIIVGAGCAGLSAAIEAHELNASVLVLEKTSKEEAGGDTNAFGGILSTMPAGALRFSSFGGFDEETAANIALESEYVVDWFRNDTTLTFIEGTSVAQGAGPAVYKALIDYTDSLGIEIIYNAPGLRLIQNSDSKEIIGVVAVKDGNEFNYKANKAVILATGGYESNQEMLKNYHFPAMEIVSVGAPSITGDGISMGQAVGVDLDCIGTSVDWFEFAFAAPSREFGTGITNRQWATKDLMNRINAEAYCAKVFVNMQGQRFMDETTLLTHNKSIALSFTLFDGLLGASSGSYVNLPMFLVCDQACIEAQALGKVAIDNYWTHAITGGVYEWSDDNQAEIDKGWLIKADTLEELATKMTARNSANGQEMTMDPEALKSTIDAYNAACELGVDTKFDRPSEYMKPIATPPFYAAEMIPCIVYTIGGLKSNGKSQCLDNRGNTIKRLYCAGNIGQGSALSPISATGCMGRARIAARDAITLDSVG
jgi:succinate dehydrogenase/fumarate reductase flavoprotein subunit